MSDLSLRSIVVRSQDLIAKIAENGGEITPDIEMQLQEIDTKTPATIDAFSTMMERLEIEGAYWKKKAEEYSIVAKGLEKAQVRMKEFMKYAIEQLNTDELNGLEVRYKLSRSKPKLVINESYLDDSWKKTETTIAISADKAKIESALKEGQQIDGAMLVETKSLRKYINTRGEK